MGPVNVTSPADLSVQIGVPTCQPTRMTPFILAISIQLLLCGKAIRVKIKKEQVHNRILCFLMQPVLVASASQTIEYNLLPLRFAWNRKHCPYILFIHLVWIKKRKTGDKNQVQSPHSLESLQEVGWRATAEQSTLQNNPRSACVPGWHAWRVPAH